MNNSCVPAHLKLFLCAVKAYNSGWDVCYPESLCICSQIHKHNLWTCVISGKYLPDDANSLNNVKMIACQLL